MPATLTSAHLLKVKNGKTYFFFSHNEWSVRFEQNEGAELTAFIVSPAGCESFIDVPVTAIPEVLEAVSSLPTDNARSATPHEVHRAIVNLVAPASGGYSPEAIAALGSLSSHPEQV